MDKPDPYGDWVLLGTKEGPTGSAVAIDKELLAAAREAWPHVLAHVRGELFDKLLGPERTALTADNLGPSAALSRENPPTESGSPTSYIQPGILPDWSFSPPFQPVLKSEHKRAETVELVSSAVDLERFEAAVDSDWAEQLERAIAVRQINRPHGWLDEESLASTTIWLFVERNFGMAWRHRTTSQNEIPIQLGKDPAEHCSDGEAPAPISHGTAIGVELRSLDSRVS